MKGFYTTVTIVLAYFLVACSTSTPTDIIVEVATTTQKEVPTATTNNELANQTIDSATITPIPTSTEAPPFVEDFEKDLRGRPLDEIIWGYDADIPITATRLDGQLQLTGSGSDQGGKYWFSPRKFNNTPLNTIGVYEVKLMLASDHDGGWVDITMALGSDVAEGWWQGVSCRISADDDRFPLAECGVTDGYSLAYSVDYDEWHTFRIEIDVETPQLFFFLDGEYWGSHIPKAEVWRDPNAVFNLGIGAFRSAGASGTNYVDDVLVKKTPELSNVELTFAMSEPSVLRVPQEYSTVQRAIFAAKDGDTVLVAEGTYKENLNFYGKNISVVSESGPELTIIDGGQSGSVVTFVNGETSAAVLEGFTITNGLASYVFAFGGGISIRDASPTIENNLVTKNGASNGGGVYIQGSDALPIVVGNKISNNIATERGGGVAIWDGATPIIQDNIIIENLAMEGAGIEVANHSSPTIIGNNVQDNWAGADMDWHHHAEQHLNGFDIKGNLEENPSFGAGILVVNHSAPYIENNNIIGNFGGGIAIIWNSSPTVKGNTIEENFGGDLGGGILVASSSSPQILENQIMGNIAMWGGGIQIFRDSSPRILMNKIANNSAEMEGGGIYVWDYSDPVIDENEFERNNASKGEAVWIGHTSSMLDHEGNLLVSESFFTSESSSGGNIGSGSVNIQSSTFSGKSRSNETLLVPDDYPSIQAAIDIANHGDIVIVSPGIYRENINFNGKEITLRSEDPNDINIVEGTIIEAKTSMPIVTFEGGETSESLLQGFTIQNSIGGGAIYIFGSGPVVKDNIIQDNVGDYGGGIRCSRSCSALIENNVISNNKALAGGGINIDLSSPVIKNNVIEENYAANGAGLFIWFSTPVIQDNIILHNQKIEGVTQHSAGGGIFVDHFSMAVIAGNTIRKNNSGGIYIDSSSPIIDRNIITENDAEIGAGLHLFLDASPLISNNIIANNTSGNGAISVGFSFPVISHNTIMNNTAVNGCDGITVELNSHIYISNTILWHEGENFCVKGTNEIDVTFSNVSNGWPGEGNISQNPLIKGNGEYHLRPDSPCIDSGSEAGIIVDIDGDLRPQGKGFDIGADEYLINE